VPGLPSGSLQRRLAVCSARRSVGQLAVPGLPSGSLQRRLAVCSARRSVGQLAALRYVCSARPSAVLPFRGGKGRESFYFLEKNLCLNINK